MNIPVYQFAPHELEKTLSVLDDAVSNHRRWFDTLHTAMLCELEFPKDILHHASHTQCQFGKWYYATGNETIRSFDEFHELEEVHRNMHDNARTLAATSIEKTKLSVNDYQQFLDSQHQLISLLSSLKTRLVEQQYVFDSLTGAVNRKSISLLLENTFENAQRYHSNYTVAMLDADNFKKINDTYGHLTGDQILKHICSSLKDTLRKSDCIGRYGGEEFLILLAETDQDTAFEVMNKYRETLSKEPVIIADQKIDISVSIGLSQFKETDEDAWQAVKRADFAMYEAKTAGRNQVMPKQENS